MKAPSSIDTDVLSILNVRVISESSSGFADTVPAGQGTGMLGFVEEEAVAQKSRPRVNVSSGLHSKPVGHTPQIPDLRLE